MYINYLVKRKWMRHKTISNWKSLNNSGDKNHRTKQQHTAKYICTWKMMSMQEDGRESEKEGGNKILIDDSSKIHFRLNLKQFDVVNMSIYTSLKRSRMLLICVHNFLRIEYKKKITVTVEVIFLSTITA